MNKWLLVSLLALFSCAATAREIKVGEQCNYPPFDYRDASGTLKGFEIDITQEIGKRIGANVKFVCMDFDGLIPALLSKKIDMIASSMSITDARKKSIDFSIPYRSSVGRFVGHKGLGLHPIGADGKPDPKALAGKIVGVQRSSTNDSYLAAEFPGVKIARYDSAENMLLDLVAGRIDLALVGPVKVETDFLDTPDGKDYEFIGPEIDAPKYFGEGVGVGFRKGDTALRDEVNKALQGMFADGTYKAINLRYWHFSVLTTVWH